MSAAPCRVLYRLHGGAVTPCGLDHFRLPDPCRAWSYFRPAVVPAPTLAMLPRLAQIAATVAPWVTVYAGPELWTVDTLAQGVSVARHTDAHGRQRVQMGGQAWADPPIILLALSTAPSNAFRSLWHELFHVISPRLSVQAHATLDAAVAEAEEFGDAYLDAPEERKARLFEHWACAVLHGLRPAFLADAGEPQYVFHAIATGQVARELQEAPPAAPKRGFLARFGAA